MSIVNHGPVKPPYGTPERAAYDAERAQRWLVWSNQHGMWWRPNRSGYTAFIEEAGRYSRAEAERIVAQATCDGQLKHTRVNPVTGVGYIGVDEVMVLAPKGTP